MPTESDSSITGLETGTLRHRHNVVALESQSDMTPKIVDCFGYEGPDLIRQAVEFRLGGRSKDYATGGSWK